MAGGVHSIGRLDRNNAVKSYRTLAFKIPVRLPAIAWGMMFHRKPTQESSEVTMRSFAVHHSRCLIVFVGVALIVSVAGCSRRTTPPGADAIVTSAPGMNIVFLRWKEGLTVLFVDDVKGGHRASGSGSTDNPVQTEIVSAGSPDTGGYKCQLETTDGKSAICRINGKEYDLSKGTLFVIKAKDEQVEVHQLKRDLKKIPFDAHDCKDPIEKDAEVRKLLGLGDLPK